MAQHYSDPQRGDDPYALPDVETFYLTAHEVAAADEDLVFEYMKRHEFRLAAMNRRVREAMLDAMVEAEGIKGGWFYWFCFPGCLPDGAPFGPYDTEIEAAQAAQDESGE